MSHKLKFHKSVQNSTHKYEVEEYVHSDVCGPFTVAGRGGELYIVTFLDNASDHSTIYTVALKGEVEACFFHYMAYSERQTGKKLKGWHTDRGGEMNTNVLWD